MVNFIVDMLYAVLDPRIAMPRLMSASTLRPSRRCAAPAGGRAVHRRRGVDRAGRAGRDLRQPAADPQPTDIDMLGKRRCQRRALLGNDQLGRDELSRLIYGGRVSLTVGLLAPVIGVTIAARSHAGGYFRGRLETFVVGGVDVLLAFPPLCLRSRHGLSRPVDPQHHPGDRHPHIPPSPAWRAP